MTRLPTDNAIADALHEAAAEYGYGPEAVTDAAKRVTRAGADEDERGAVLAACQRVWAERFEVWGAC